MGCAIGIGVGIRGQWKTASGAVAPVPPEPPVELSCYATGVWIDRGIWRMADSWNNGEEESIN